MGEADTKGISLSTRIAYTHSKLQELYSGEHQVEDPLDRVLRAELFSLATSVRFMEGVSLSMTLPFGVVRMSNLGGETRSAGLGDMSFRIRQDASKWYERSHPAIPRVSFSVGLIAPTGQYQSQQDVSAANFEVAVNEGLAAPGSQFSTSPQSGGEVYSIYATLGRGSWDLIGDVQLSWRPLTALGVYMGVRGRARLFSAFESETFWGPEVGSQVGVVGDFPDAGISLILGAEHLWRGLTTGVMNGVELDFINSGGHWFSVTPSVVFTPMEDVRLRLSSRVPVHQDVKGFQLVADPSVMLDLSFRWEVGGAEIPTHEETEEAPGCDPDEGKEKEAGPDVVISDGRSFEVADILVPGKINLVDYFATWCEPCHVLDARIREAIKDRDDIVLRKVNIVSMESNAAKQHLSGVPSIPVLDIYDEKGEKRIRLTGADAMGFEAHIKGPVDEIVAPPVSNEVTPAEEPVSSEPVQGSGSEDEMEESAEQSNETENGEEPEKP